MLTNQQLAEELARVTYKPGWAFSIEETGWEDPRLRIVVVDVENSYRPGEFLDLGIDTPLPPMPDADYFHRFLAWRIERIESHEVREWFKVDHVAIYDPHPKEA